MLKHPLKGDLVTALFCCHQLTVVYWWIWMGVGGNLQDRIHRWLLMFRVQGLKSGDDKYINS